MNHSILLKFAKRRYSKALSSFVWRFKDDQWKNLIDSEHLNELKSPSFNIDNLEFQLKAQRYHYKIAMLRQTDYILMSLCLNAFPQNMQKVNIGYNFDTNPDDLFEKFVSTSAYDTKGCILFDQNNTEQKIALIDCEFNDNHWKKIPEMEMFLFRLKPLYIIDNNDHIKCLDLDDWCSYFSSFNSSKLSEFSDHLEDIQRLMPADQKANNKAAVMKLINEMIKTIDYTHSIVNIDHLRESNHIKQFPYQDLKNKLDDLAKQYESL